MTTPEQLLQLAEMLDTRFGGMASIELYYHPYETKWKCEASWSSAMFISGEGKTSSAAMENLRNNLNTIRTRT